MLRSNVRTDPTQRWSWLRFAWLISFTLLISVRLWNVVHAPLLRGYDDLGHVGYILYLDLYQAVPFADQGWSYFHPPLHYLFGWALAQFDDVALLLRGLSALGGLTSLAIAFMAARIIRSAVPERDDLALLGFLSVGLLPVYLYSATMAGNELTAAFFAHVGLLVFISNECRDEPTLSRDALAGLALGLALLTKVSAAVYLLAAGLSLAARIWRDRSLLESVRRSVVRGVLLAGVALLIASPYYARNQVEFGTPLLMSRDNPHVRNVESWQKPGSRHWADLVHFPLAVFADPDPQEEHLLHSVWGSAYAQMWADSRASYDLLPDSVQPRIRATRSAMAVLGLAPTVLALLGAGLAALDVLRGRRRALYVPLFACSAATLASFVYFAFAAPMFSALKASYLLGLTFPYAVFLARALEQLGRAPALRWAGATLVVIPALASAVVYSDSLVLPHLGNPQHLGSLEFYFGDDDRHQVAVEHFEREQAAKRRGVWIRNLAAAALVEGDAQRARLLYGSFRRPGQQPFLANAYGVAVALTGEPQRAIRIFDQAIEDGAGEVGLVNRGAVYASLGRQRAAERDLRRALEFDRHLAPAWHALAELLEREGRQGEAASARQRADTEARGSAPRHHPYGIPNAFGQAPSPELGYRWMLWPEADQLLLAQAPFRAEDAIAMKNPPGALAGLPNLVLIVVDALRPDHLGAYGSPRPTSPNIDRLARQGTRFANATATSSWSLPSIASLMTSQPVELHGVATRGASLSEIDVDLASRLGDAGYRTVGVSGNSHIRAQAGFARGFGAWTSLASEIDGASPHPLSDRGDPVARRAPTAAEINREVLERLPRSEPLFLFVHYMDPHSDYAPPERHRRRFETDPSAHAEGRAAHTDTLVDLLRGRATADERERQRLIDLYDAEIASVDEAIGELLASLQERGFGDDLFVALVSDHGESFGEHDAWLHGVNLHSEVLRIPMIFWDSQRPRPEIVREDPASLIDVATTLLARAGIEAVRRMRGRDLLAAGPRAPRELSAVLEHEALLEERLGPRPQRRSLLLWPWKAMVTASGETWAYHLEDDPRELEPVVLSDPRIPARLRGVVAEARAEVLAANRAQRLQSAGAGSSPSPEDRAQARALEDAQ